MIEEEPFLGIGLEHEKDCLKGFVTQFIVCLCVKFGFLGEIDPQES